jgi:hypothetical protein
VGILPAHKRLIENGATKSRFSCGVGILPAHKRLIENGATYELKQTMVKALKWRILAILTSVAESALAEFCGIEVSF